jgi:hypothetical protein
MSGALAIGIGAAASIEGLSAGPAVMIGGVALTGFEVPETMPWGTEQQLVDHKMPGGGRIVDAMGPLEALYRWKGAFTGPTASYRAHQMDTMAAAGAAVPLVWGEDSRLVVIRSFHCQTTRGGWWLPYDIECIGIPQPGAAAQQPTLLGQTNADLTNAAAVPGQIDPNDATMAAAGTAAETAQVALPASGALLAGSAAYNTAGTAAATAGAAVDGLLAGAQMAVGALAAPASALLSPSGSGTALGTLQAAVTGTGELAGLSSMAGFLGRAAVNLGVSP